MSDLVGNPEDRFSRVAAHNMLLTVNVRYLATVSLPWTACQNAVYCLSYQRYLSFSSHRAVGLKLTSVLSQALELVKVVSLFFFFFSQTYSR